MKEKVDRICRKLNKSGSIDGIIGEIQDTIVMTKSIYGAKVDEKNIMDYTLEKDMLQYNNRDCYLLAGERRFLYECYKAAVSDVFNDYEKNLFYIYLSIRTHFRGELIQVNRQVGFANFNNYQNRKEIFIEGEKPYEDEMIRLALNATLKNQNIVSLEARICPKKSSAKLYKAIMENERIVKSQTHYREVLKENNPQTEGIEEKIIYVLHFPKSADKEFCLGSPRNYNVRASTLEHVRKVVALLEKGTNVNKKIRGIDACSNEIYCRPEVFAQFFRYLSEVEFDCNQKSYGLKGIPASKAKLHKTYHVGEDFLDIIDGIRAIDEAILFCGLERGCRIGHGLALGINPYEYYKYKGYKLILPKQVLLDDIVWILSKSDEMGCTIESRLRTELEERYNNLYEEIYGGNVIKQSKASIMDYYQSWKLRGDNPSVYRLEENEFLKRMQQTPLQRLDRYEFNNKVSDCIRKIESYRNLYFAYHYNKRVREIGEERTELKVDQRYADIVCQIQDKMIRQLVREGIGIETNPSSNYLIGTIKKYEEHPILRFNARKLKHIESNVSMNVSINTDDQGVFDTLLENEYALMALALKKAKDADFEPLYDIEDIYEWVDYVRKMGIEQIFK